MITIHRVTYQEAIAPIQHIRRQVFQLEQGVPLELEFDGEDDAAVHFLAYDDAATERPAVGTTRLRLLPNPSPSPARTPVTSAAAKIERVAVLSDYRGQGIGQLLMEEAIAYLQQQGISVIKINAQRSVQSFYERLGFVCHGQPFEDAGIPHIAMVHEP